MRLEVEEEGSSYLHAGLEVMKVLQEERDRRRFHSRPVDVDCSVCVHCRQVVCCVCVRGKERDSSQPNSKLVYADTPL